ncbi:MAG: hypothetical protein ACP5H3_02075 [Candidatus Aenigmatarchaeota archaeon]|uniref:hypothetical protein n=1 Tax=Caldisericum sp. TaxID=2499687 RepID=UPI003D0B53B7
MKRVLLIVLTILSFNLVFWKNCLSQDEERWQYIGSSVANLDWLADDIKKISRNYETIKEKYLTCVKMTNKTLISEIHSYSEALKKVREKYAFSIQNDAILPKLTLIELSLYDIFEFSLIYANAKKHEEKYSANLAKKDVRRSCKIHCKAYRRV